MDSVAIAVAPALVFRERKNYKVPFRKTLEFDDHACCVCGATNIADSVYGERCIMCGPAWAPGCDRAWMCCKLARTCLRRKDWTQDIRDRWSEVGDFVLECGGIVAASRKLCVDTYRISVALSLIKECVTLLAAVRAIKSAQKALVSRNRHEHLGLRS